MATHLYELYKSVTRMNTMYQLRKWNRGTWQAQLVELVTLDLGVMGSSPTLGIEFTYKNFFFEKREKHGMGKGSSEIKVK